MRNEHVNGGGGIAIEGRESEYAEELWLESPSAFWLHPEGPLSETTPDEWMAKREVGLALRREAERQRAKAQFNAFACQNATSLHYLSQSQNPYMSGLQAAQSGYLNNSAGRPLLGLFGLPLF